MSKMNNKLEEVLNKEGFLIYPIKGISMLPLLEEKVDTVKILPIKDELKKYDVALYYGSKDTYILHRVLEVGKKYYYICGDNCNTLEKVPKANVIGYMAGYFKKKRYVSCNDDEYLDYVNSHIVGVDYKTREKLYPKVPKEWVLMFKLISSTINNYKLDDSDYADIDWKKFVFFAKHHSISCILYSKLDKNKVPEDVYKTFYDAFNLNLKKTVLFNSERKRIIDLFEKENINYIYLKGIITNTFYPQMGLREFADNDILIKDEDSKAVKKIMLGLNYTPISLRGVHDSYHKEPVYNFEFHRNLFDRIYKFSKYFNSIWTRVKKNGDSNEYKMSNEDNYMYNLAHFYKHYSNGGAGIRSFIDMYLIKKNIYDTESFDKNYVDEKLKEIGLYDFFNEINDLMYKMFNDTENLNYKEIIYIMESGTYGLQQNGVNNKLDDLHGSKVGYILKRIFIPYRNMKIMFPVLRYLPILLPVFWFIRLFKPLFNKDSRKNANGEFKAMKNYRKK